MQQQSSKEYLQCFHGEEVFKYLPGAQMNIQTPEIFSTVTLDSRRAVVSFWQKNVHTAG